MINPTRDINNNFFDRKQAGIKLAEKLKSNNHKDRVVLALPRGGVVLGFEVARALNLPLGVILVKKIGHPSNHEYAIGAIARGQEPVINQAEQEAVDKEWLESMVKDLRHQIELRHRAYSVVDSIDLDIKNKDVIIVDDGIATGYTMLAAVKYAKENGSKYITVAVPVASADSYELINKYIDKFVCLIEPDNFCGYVGGHYTNFDEITDDEVISLLEASTKLTRRGLVKIL